MKIKELDSIAWRFRCIVSFSILFIILMGHASAQPTRLLDSSDYHVLKGGLGNSYLKFTMEKTGRVAFLGGSITQMSGWRDLICTYLQERFTETRFEFINAGVGSTGSMPGAYRIKRDLLDKGVIDLLFEEAAVNDRSDNFNMDMCIRGMEGIVAHARRANRYTDMVIMYFVDPGKMKDYNEGRIPPEIQAHEKVAQHYGIPVIHLAREVTDRIRNQEFSWEKDFIDLHPSPFGQEIYFRSIKTFLENNWKQAENQHKKRKHPLPGLMDRYSYVNGQFADIKLAQPDPHWAMFENWSPDNSLVKHKMCQIVPVLASVKPGATVHFRFRGKAAGFCAVTGPDAGTVEYSIDGRYSGKVDLFTNWSREYNLPRFVVFEDELKTGWHDLEIRISEEKNPSSEGNACRILYFLVNK